MKIVHTINRFSILVLIYFIAKSEQRRIKIRLNRAKRLGASKSNSNISIEEPIERNNYGTASIRSILEKNSNDLIEDNKMESHAIK
jgi:hypothetical protein